VYLARVYITLKEGVFDPQGEAVKKGLHALKHQEVLNVRVGKYLEVLLESPSQEEALERVEAMCRELLANPVIEDYRLELEVAP